MPADLPFAIAFDSNGQPKVKNTKTGRKVNPKKKGAKVAGLTKGKRVKDVFNISVMQVSGSCTYVVMIGGDIYEIVIPNMNC
jgi:hypothetical protein